jgi:hypothetical protein
MKHVSDHAQKPERPQNLAELRRNLSRRLSDISDGWERCDKQLCRRRQQCCGDGPDFKCTDDGSPPRTFSREETAKAMSDLYREIKKRRAEFAAGAEPMDEETLRKLRDEPRAVTRRRRKPARAAAAKRVADLPQAHDAEPAPPVAKETPPSPEKQERIDRDCNDHAASLPAEEDRQREPGPRITML